MGGDPAIISDIYFLSAVIPAGPALAVPLLIVVYICNTMRNNTSILISIDKLRQYFLADDARDG